MHLYMHPDQWGYYPVECYTTSESGVIGKCIYEAIFYVQLLEEWAKCLLISYRMDDDASMH